METILDETVWVRYVWCFNKNYFLACILPTPENIFKKKVLTKVNRAKRSLFNDMSHDPVFTKKYILHISAELFLEKIWRYFQQ